MRAWFAALPVRRRLIVAGGIAVAGASVVVGWHELHSGAPPSAATAAPVPTTEEGGAASSPTLLVFVSGAVVHPGLYHLTASARVADALAAAGGVTSNADPNHLPDEAAAIHDGRQINVPFRRGGSARTQAARVDLNTADLDELRAVPGMPPGLPEAIIDHRLRWGPFASVGELRTMLGVDRPTASALGHWLRAPGPTP